MEKLTDSKPWKRSLLEKRHHSLIFIAGVVLLLVAAGYLILERGQPFGMTRTKQLAAAVAVPMSEPGLKEIVASFGRNQTITDALVKHGFSGEQVFKLVESARPVYNLARVAASRPYWLHLTAAGDFHDFRYAVDDERYLTVYQQDGHFVPVMKNFNYETRVEPVSGSIEDSLFSSITAEGEQDILALQLADIFMWDIDFYTDIQKGDSFHMLVEKKYLGGKFVKYGSILAADIKNQGREFAGFRFHDASGSPAYYGPDGQAMKKSFLKSPLKFARISSRFSRSRLHPILKIFRPHMGVDYAAPIGTPVQAVGAGVVTAAGSQAGSGKMLKVRHAGGYETMYLHLSRIAVRPGARIQQGDVIGYVGSSGLSTGPHLDFRVLSHGHFINPTKVIFPPNPPVPKNEHSEFDELRQQLQGRLARIKVERKAGV